MKKLADRLATASLTHSLRKLSQKADVSHERIRQIIIAKGECNVTSETITKLEGMLDAIGC